MTGQSRRFRFVQFEFPWALGPEPGRYTIREHLGEPPAQVLVLALLGAAERRRLQPGRRGLLLLRRRQRAAVAAAEPAPTPVVTARATLVDTAALDGYEAAARWLAEADLERLARDALARLNRVLHAHRVAAADVHAREVSRAQALVVRVGFGAGERVADGRWDHARELPAAAGAGAGARAGGGPGAGLARRAAARTAALRPQERLAALLAGRDAALACEELALRARLDLDTGRLREAALQLQVALEAALAELEPWREQTGLAQRLAELRGHRDAVAAAANAALRGGLDDEHVTTVQAVLARVEAALRARTAGQRL